MNVRRIVGAVAATTMATGATLLFAGSSGAAPTPPTPISFDATGLASSSCPVNLPLNNKIALPPGTPIQFNPGLVNGVLAILVGSETLTVTPVNDAGQAISAATTHALPWAAPVSYAAGTYKLTWVAKTLLGVVTTTGAGTLQVAAGASGCQLAVSLPGVVVSPSQLPVVGGVVGSILPPVSIPGVPLPVPNVPIPGLPGTTPTPGPTTPGITLGGQPGVNYHPTGPTVADLTVPHGYGGGSGAASNYVAPGLSNSLVAPGTNFVTGGGSNATTASGAAGPVVPAPHTVDVASSKSRSALDALPTLMVVLAVIALSGATAFYARTFLLHEPHTAKVA
jgi:hypothetical protein